MISEANKANGSCNSVFPKLTTIPAKNKDLVLTHTDDHGLPTLSSGHGVCAAGRPTIAFGVPNAYDWNFCWKVWDALQSCAYSRKWCRDALGNTPEHRSMGAVERRQTPDPAEDQGSGADPPVGSDRGTRAAAQLPSGAIEAIAASTSAPKDSTAMRMSDSAVSSSLAWLMPPIEGQKSIAAGTHARHLRGVVERPADELSTSGDLPRRGEEAGIEVGGGGTPYEPGLESTASLLGRRSRFALHLAQHPRQGLRLRVAQVDDQVRPARHRGGDPWPKR